MFIDNTKLFNIGSASPLIMTGYYNIIERSTRIMSSYKMPVRKRMVEGGECFAFCRDFICAAKNYVILETHIVKYEDFCNDHVTTLQAICTFIGVQFEKKIKHSIIKATKDMSKR